MSRPDRQAVPGNADEQPSASPATAAWVLARGAVAGAACFLATFVLVGGLFAADFGTAFEGTASGDPIRTVQRLGWVVYNAHFVRLRAWLALNVIDLAAADLLVPAPVYYALPPAVLVGGSYTVARRAPPGAYRLFAGMAVLAGYLPAAALGAAAVSTPSAGPELVPAVLRAGVAYPVACGTVGGLLADRE